MSADEKPLPDAAEVRLIENQLTLWGLTLSERDWPEDFSHENGAYMNRCIHCSQTFTGYKRRVVCKVCDTSRAKS